MKQRPDTSAAHFLRPEFGYIIEWQLDGHGVLVTQRGNSRETLSRCLCQARWSGRLTQTPLQQFAPGNPNEYRDRCHSRTQLGEQFAMTCVEGQLVFERHLDVAGEHAFGKRASSVIL